MGKPSQVLMTQVSLVRQDGPRRQEVVTFIQPRYAVLGRGLVMDGDPGWIVNAVYETMLKSEISPWDARFDMLRSAS